ncbi:serine/arginine repetitive matrix protein 5-like isoform X2 [Dysidea avara]|uniref:serine/arginine repetitive matrix protein 5-like isoform X2 n=1 Tax=Dysidea avara TaxID=196820 RepID=UPI0033260E58
MDDLDDLDLLRKKALESRKKESERDELRLHPDEDLETSYAARKKSARKKVAKRKSAKETSKKGEETPKAKDEPVAHFINPHGGFMAYSTLSLAVKRTSDMGHLSPISSDSPSPVNLHSTEEKLQALAAAAAAKSKPKPVESKPPATDKPVVQAKPVAATSVKSTKPDIVDKGKESKKEQAASSKPASKSKERRSRSRSSSSGSSSSFSSSSASSFSSKSSSSQRRKKRRHSSSSSSSSHSSSSLSTSSSSSSSSRSHRSSSSSGSGSRKHKHRSRQRSSKERQSHRRHSTEREHDKNRSRKRHDDRDNDNEGGRHFIRGSSRFISQRGRGRGDFHRPGGFQRDRNYPDGDRPQRFFQREPQDYRREVRVQRPFNRPSFGRGRQTFRPSFNPPQFRNVIVRSRGRDFRNQQQRPIGGRYRPGFQSDYRRPSDRFSNKRHREDDSPEYDRQRRRVHSESSDHHRSSRVEHRGSRSNYDSKIGAPIKESRDPGDRRPRSYSDSNHSRHSENKSSPRRPKSPAKSTGSRKSDDEEMEPELELQPESDLELEPSRMEIDALLEQPLSDIDTGVSNKKSDNGKNKAGKKRAASSSSSTSGSSSSGSSSSASSPDRNQQIKSPIRVSPERRDYKSKQGAVIRRNDENSHHTRSQGQKRFFTESASSLEKVSKRLRPDLALRLGPDPDLAQQQEDFVPTRQRFYNNSGPGRGDALEIARQFRLQKKQATRKVSVSKPISVCVTDTVDSSYPTLVYQK